MGFFRRGETLNERMLREAGLDAPTNRVTEDPEQPPDVYDPVVEGRMMTGWGGPMPSQQGDVVVIAEAPDVAGSEVRFYALADGSVIVDEEEGEAQLDSLANAVEKELRPPYVAHALRRDRRFWDVSAFRIDVLSFDAPGDEIEVARREGSTTATVDGVPGDPVPELEEFGERYGSSFAVEATRLEGDTWAVRGGVL